MGCHGLAEQGGERAIEKKASVISVTNDSKAPGAEYKGEKDPYWTVQSRVLNVPNPLLHRDWNLANLLDGKNFAVI